MKKTKVKVLLMCIVSFLMLLCLTAKVEASTDYTVKYDELGDRKVRVTISFDEEIDSNKLSSSWKLEDSKVISKDVSEMSYGFESITMADDSKKEIEYATPATLYMYGATIRPSTTLKNYKIADESIVKFNEENNLEAVKPGKTQVTATYTNASTTKDVVFDVTVKYPTAEDWTDMSKVTYEIAQDNTSYYNYRVIFSNMTAKEKHSYSIIMGNTTDAFFDEDNIFYGTLDISSENYIGINTNNADIKSFVIDKWLEKSGDIYFQVVESYRPENCETYANKVIMKKTKIERPIYKIGTKLKGYFFNDETSIFNFTPSHDGDKRVVKLKIGRIDDLSLLRAIKNGESRCMENLMEYAKKADSVYEGQVPVGKSGSVTGTIDMSHNEYMYVYMSLQDENNEFYTIEDIGLYQANVSESVGKNLFSSLDSQFVWNLPEEPVNNNVEPNNQQNQTNGEEEKPTVTNEEEKPTITNAEEKPTVTNTEEKPAEEKKDPTVVPAKVLPQTGENMVAVAVIAILGITVYVSYKKFKGIRIK